MGLNEFLTIEWLLSNFAPSIPVSQHSLAQTWVARPEFYRPLSQDITAIQVFSKQVAPGQAIIPYRWHKLDALKRY